MFFIYFFQCLIFFILVDYLMFIHVPAMFISMADIAWNLCYKPSMLHVLHVSIAHETDCSGIKVCFQAYLYKPVDYVIKCVTNQCLFSSKIKMQLNAQVKTRSPHLLSKPFFLYSKIKSSRLKHGLTLRNAFLSFIVNGRWTT